ncbi:MAG: RnfABCDGE type electron transport complex subunit B [Synergistaceae bacterium]|nr:RnfABCDGE type electron transport complex subunit B [Synergistaceae bacterium]
MMRDIIISAIIMGSLGVIFGSLLAFASQKFAVEVDERQAKIRALLPGANCGGCGFAGCDAYADALVQQTTKLGKCSACTKENLELIAEILGQKADASVPCVAVVRCKGTCDKIIGSNLYEGTMDCRLATRVPGNSPVSCQFGCIGLGTCVSVCKFDAISVKDGIAVVDREKCVGCGTCVANCPKGVITLIPKTSRVTVKCQNTHKGLLVKKVCNAGCIGCMLCVKSCPKQAIFMQENLAVIDTDKCVNCGICVQKCPVKVIDKEA